MSTYPVLQKKVQRMIQENIETRETLQRICSLLRDEIPHYDWVGFYFANHQTKTLHLEAYSGDKTEHTQIAFGKGICGQVAETNRNFIVDDVRSQDNYIACSVAVQSEIVIPIFVKGVNIGQIDIDSHTPRAFTEEDEAFLEFVCLEVAQLYV